MLVETTTLVTGLIALYFIPTKSLMEITKQVEVVRG
jgi:hypothetical protein